VPTRQKSPKTPLSGISSPNAVTSCHGFLWTVWSLLLISEPYTPHPPRPSLSLVRSPPVSHFVREGGRLGVGCAVFGSQGGVLWVEQNARTSPPRFALPPGVGRDRWHLERWCFAPGRFENCDEFHEGARCEPRRSNPRQEAHQTWGAATSVSEEAGGVFPHSAKPTQ